MKLSFTLDNKLYLEELPSLSPLSHLLCELKKEGFIFNPSLLKLVLLDGVLVSARHVPVIYINNSQIVTKEGITRQPHYKASVLALKERHLSFCPLCEASRFILFYSLMQQKKRDHSRELWQFHQCHPCHCLAFPTLYSCFLRAEELLHLGSL